MRGGGAEGGSAEVRRGGRGRSRAKSGPAAPASPRLSPLSCGSGKAPEERGGGQGRGPLSARAELLGSFRRRLPAAERPFARQRRGAGAGCPGRGKGQASPLSPELPARPSWEQPRSCEPQRAKHGRRSELLVCLFVLITGLIPERNGATRHLKVAYSGSVELD